MLCECLLTAMLVGGSIHETHTQGWCPKLSYSYNDKGLTITSIHGARHIRHTIRVQPKRVNHADFQYCLGTHSARIGATTFAVTIKADDQLV